MDYLVSFLKSSSLIDFAFISAAVFAGVVLVVTGGAMLFAARTRKFFFAYPAAALLPLIIGLGGTAARWYSNERVLALNDIDPSSSNSRRAAVSGSSSSNSPVGIDHPPSDSHHH